MAIKIGHSSIDENGKARGGAAGDQTGREVCITKYFSSSWDAVLRPKSAEVAEKSAKFVEQACANNNVGYDQWGRNTLFAEAKKVNFDCSKITVKCECDCSSLMHVAVVAAGANLEYGSNGFTTRTMINRLVATGDYEKLTDSKYLTSDKYLRRGDILVNVGSHTVMVLENGSGVAVAALPSTTQKESEIEMKEIKYGSIGKEVKIWQVILGFEGDDVDGIFGKDTKARTVTLQKKAFPNDKKEWDGVVGPKTWKVGFESL